MVRHLTLRYHEVSKPRDSSSNFSNRSDIWQASWQQRCQDACQMSERYDHYNIHSRGFQTSRDLAVRSLTTKWIEALDHMDPLGTPDCTTKQSVDFMGFDIYLTKRDISNALSHWQSNLTKENCESTLLSKKNHTAHCDNSILNTPQKKHAHKPAIQSTKFLQATFSTCN